MLRSAGPSDFRAGESFRLDADNREGNGVQCDRRPDDVGAAGEAALPVAVAEHRDCDTRTIVVCVEEPA